MRCDPIVVLAAIIVAIFALGLAWCLWDSRNVSNRP